MGDLGLWVGIVALVISLYAAVLARRSATAAERSADAACRSARATEETVALEHGKEREVWIDRLADALPDWKRVAALLSDLPASLRPQWKELVTSAAGRNPRTPEEYFGKLLDQHGAAWEKARDVGPIARNLRELLDEKSLVSFEISGLEDAAPEITTARVAVRYELEGEIAEKEIDLRMLHLDERGSPLVRGHAGGSWTVLNFWGAV